MDVRYYSAVLRVCSVVRRNITILESEYISVGHNYVLGCVAKLVDHDTFSKKVIL